MLTWFGRQAAIAPAETSHDICKSLIVEGDAGARARVALADPPLGLLQRVRLPRPGEPHQHRPLLLGRNRLHLVNSHLLQGPSPKCPTTVPANPPLPLPLLLGLPALAVELPVVLGTATPYLFRMPFA